MFNRESYSKDIRLQAKLDQIFIRLSMIDQELAIIERQTKIIRPKKPNKGVKNK